MAKFKKRNLRLENNEKIIFGTNNVSNLWFDGHELRLDTTISGIDPTHAYHFSTRYYVDSEITTISGFLNNKIDIKDHGALTGLNDDDHLQYVLHTHGIGIGNLVAGAGAGVLLEPESEYNILLGEDAGHDNQNGGSNIYIGRGAGYHNTSCNNVMIGYVAGYKSTSANCCTFVGDGAGYETTTGIFNTFIGQRAGWENVDGLQNTFVGNDAGYYNISGHKNTYLGYSTGSNSGQSDDYRVFIGYQAGRQVSSVYEGSSLLVIQSSETVSDIPLIYGNFDADKLGINITTLPETFNVGGAIHIGTTANTNAGAIRYTGSDFEGYHNGQWISFTTTSGNHNELNVIQGGTVDEYYHLTLTQHTSLTDGGDSISHKHDDRYYTEIELNAGQLDNRYYTKLEIDIMEDKFKSGRESLAPNDSSKTVIFNTSFADINYTINVILSTTDITPSIYSMVITNKTIAGFTAIFSGNVDSANYKLEWMAKHD